MSQVAGSAREKNSRGHILGPAAAHCAMRSVSDGFWHRGPWRQVSRDETAELCDEIWTDVESLVYRCYYLRVSSSDIETDAILDRGKRFYLHRAG